jgi:adhesion G protein-coupled receptor L1
MFSISAGFQLYIMLTTDDMLLEVEKSSRILWYYFFTYGLSFLIVAISLAINPIAYTQADYCLWMEPQFLFYSTFLLPIVVFVLVSVRSIVRTKRN